MWVQSKFEDNDLKLGCYRISKLPPLSVKYVCPISHKKNHPIKIPKIVLKSVLWHGSESALNCCIFQLLCFSLHPIVYPPSFDILQFWSKELVLCSNLCQKHSFRISRQLIKMYPQFPDELSPRFSVKIIRCLFYAYKKHTNGKSSCTVISIVLVSVSCQNVSANIHRECSFSWWRPVVFVGS